MCILRCVEHCPSYRLVQGQGRPSFAHACPPALVFYFCYLDPHLGLIHIRVPTLFPWSIQIAVNGHDYLAQQMARARMSFTQEDNAFVEIDDPEKAQHLANGFLDAVTPTRLRQLALRVLPPLADVLRSMAHTWVVDQAEVATDLVFRDPRQLAEVYPRLVNHAALHFKAPDILGFLGRKLCPQFDGKVRTDCKKDRLPGLHVKHRMKGNWIKMYDKRGRMLRVETVINNPREFQVRRRCRRHGRQVLAYVPMNKGVSNLYRYLEVGRAANGRYLAALTAVAPPAPAVPQAARDLDRLGQTVRHHDRPYAGFNPARPTDRALFAALGQGQYLLNGFRNADLRGALSRCRRRPRRTPPPQRRRQPPPQTPSRPGPALESPPHPPLAPHPDGGGVAAEAGVGGGEFGLAFRDCVFMAELRGDGGRTKDSWCVDGPFRPSGKIRVEFPYPWGWG